MVDTITLRIHNIKRYKLLFEQFKVVSEKNKTMTQGQIVVDEDGVVSEKYKLWQRVRAFGDTGKFLPDTHRIQMHAPSSNYAFNAVLKKLDTDQAFLEIEFSLPKYLNGTNVFQLLGIPL